MTDYKVLKFLVFAGPLLALAGCADTIDHSTGGPKRYAVTMHHTGFSDERWELDEEPTIVGGQPGVVRFTDPKTGDDITLSGSFKIEKRSGKTAP